MELVERIAEFIAPRIETYHSTLFQVRASLTDCANKQFVRGVYELPCGLLLIIQCDWADLGTHYKKRSARFRRVESELAALNTQITAGEINDSKEAAISLAQGLVEVLYLKAFTALREKLCQSKTSATPPLPTDITPTAKNA